jgi:carbon monoxide dehydrogenase subunit G
MGTARAETTIAKPADEVWKVIGNFGELTWMPGVDTCRLEGQDRVLGMFGMEITEREFEHDDAKRTLTYGIVAGPVQVEKHRATITVNPQGDSSQVTWDVDTDDAMTEMMQKTYQGSLDALKAQLEG